MVMSMPLQLTEAEAPGALLSDWPGQAGQAGRQEHLPQAGWEGKGIHACLLTCPRFRPACREKHPTHRTLPITVYGASLWRMV